MMLSLAYTPVGDFCLNLKNDRFDREEANAR